MQEDESKAAIRIENGRMEKRETGSSIRPPDAFAEEMQRRADRLCNMILHLDIEWVDVAIQIEHLRDFCRENAPEKLAAFEMIYESRFVRFWQQWRETP